MMLSCATEFGPLIVFHAVNAKFQLMAEAQFSGWEQGVSRRKTAPHLPGLVAAESNRWSMLVLQDLQI
ncbi:hypothetical protein D6B98_37015 [Bradyrhizobium sp. LVM 105]|nr:hypothetical protein D6B98_37015 [Bradyrhizobium sp. LVM 105]